MPHSHVTLTFPINILERLVPKRSDVREETCLEVTGKGARVILTYKWRECILQTRLRARAHLWARVWTKRMRTGT